MTIVSPQIDITWVFWALWAKTYMSYFFLDQLRAITQYIAISHNNHNQYKPQSYYAHLNTQHANLIL